LRLQALVAINQPDAIRRRRGQLMSPDIQAFASGFPLVMLHGAVSLGLLAAGCLTYAVLTPHREIQLIRQGNSAAALSFGGVMVGFAMPMAASLAASASVREIALWGAVVVVLQLLAFRLIDVLLTGLPQRIRDGEVAAAGLLVAAKLSVALILSAALFD
jgi:putative membrane protein